MRIALPFITLAAGLLFAISVLAADKVVVIPLNSAGGSPEKVWGEGRVGTFVQAEDTVNGITISRSIGTASWDGAAAACPKNTWVCSLQEIKGLRTDSLTSFVQGLKCDGSAFSPSITWVQDEYSLDRTKGKAAAVVDFFGWVFLEFNQPKCQQLPVWCCSFAQ